MKRIELRTAVDALARHYGEPAAPRVTDPFEQIVLENASYLVDDETRYEVFAELKVRIGTSPQALSAAKPVELAKTIEPGGMRPPMRARKLVEAARIASALEAPLAAIVQRPFAEAARVLKRFPGVGAPGAEKIALFAGAHPVLGLESNGLRVLTRLGFGQEHEGYDRTWREVRDAVKPELPTDIGWLRRAHQLLRRHGQELCKRTRPLCAECPLARNCPAAPRPRA